MTVPAAVLTEIRTLRVESVPSWPAVSLAERQTLLRAERFACVSLYGTPSAATFTERGRDFAVNAFADVTVTTIRSPEKEGEAFSLGAAPAAAAGEGAGRGDGDQREGPIHGAKLQARCGEDTAATSGGRPRPSWDFRKR